MTPAWQSYVTFRVEYQVRQTDGYRASKSSTQTRDHRGSPPFTGPSSVMLRIATTYVWPKEQAKIVHFGIGMNETLTSANKEHYSFQSKRSPKTVEDGVSAAKCGHCHRVLLSSKLSAGCKEHDLYSLRLLQAVLHQSLWAARQGQTLEIHDL